MTLETTHLVLGDTAAIVLDDAMAAGAVVRAPIVRFRDIYCIGPLTALGTADGPASRARYWGELLPDSPPPVAEFDDEEARYAAAAEVAGHGSILVWTGAHASSQLWLRRLATFLSARGGDIRVVEASDTERRRRTMTQFEPTEFSPLIARARRLDAEAMRTLSDSWRHHAARPSAIRRWFDGGITHHGDDYYDGLLLAQCDEAWQPAEQAIGSAQWECDEFLGDVFFAWRLRHLAQTGRVWWRGPALPLADAEVRLPTPAVDSAVTH